MIINETDPSRQYLPLVQQLNEERGVNYENNVTFADTMRNFVKDVDGLQKESADAVSSFIKGDPIDLHDVMISSQKASTSFQLLMELRNKGLDLYRTVSRMQV